MKKKVVSVILAMTMVASMAMGCGNSSDTTTSDNSTTTTTTNDAAASTEASDAADATADAANGSHNRRSEGCQSDRMGAENEQHPRAGRRNRTVGFYL